MVDVMLTTEQVAQRTALSIRHVRNLLVSGALPGVKRGIRSWGVFESKLDKWLLSRGNQPAKRREA